MKPMPVILSVLLFAGCVIFRHALEADPVTHVLVQLPLLAVSGVLMIRGVAAHSFDMPTPIANALTLVAVFAILFWMLPRYIDATLVSPLVETAKFVSIPLLVGFPLAIAWSKSHPFLRGFLKANAISMLGILAFLYTHAPVRICNSYLVADQERLGYGFLIAAFVLGGVWSIQLFFPQTGSSRELRLSTPISLS
jgi:hypothetical protein